MGGGIVIPAVQDIEVAYSIAANIYASVTSIRPSSSLTASQGPWRPPQWSNSALTILTVSGTPTTYVFDAVFLASHRSVLTTTRNPVLTGANIVDHAYLEPKEVILEIGMSDAMDEFSAGMWSGATTKSISAYQVLLNLQKSRSLLTLTSRLETVQNMLIVDVSARDDVDTLNGLRATVYLQQIIMATTSSAAMNSARPQDTGQTQNGTLQPTAPSNQVTQQFQIPKRFLQPFPGTISGAGSWSSNPIASLAK